MTLFADNPDPGSLPFRVLFYFLVSFASGCAYIVGRKKMACHSIKTDESRKGTGEGIPLS